MLRSITSRTYILRVKANGDIKIMVMKENCFLQSWAYIDIKTKRKKDKKEREREGGEHFRILKF